MFRKSYIMMFYTIKGVMLGIAYDSEDFPEDNVSEHTLQISLFIFVFTFMWENELENQNNNYAS